MRFRRMRPEELPEVISVYESRFSMATGLVHRNKARWELLMRGKNPKIFWLIAEEKGRIVAYTMWTMDRVHCDMGEVIWRPEYDGTPLGEDLFREAYRRVSKMKPAFLNIWGMEGSLTLTLPRPSEFQRYEATGIFMAGVIDVRTFMGDLRRILDTRVKKKLCLHVGRRSFVYGARRKRQTCAWVEANTILGMILGTTSLSEEIRKGRLTYAPKNKESLQTLGEAFPNREFWIEDGW